LEKAIHFLEKLIELEDAKQYGTQLTNAENEARHMLYLAMNEAMKAEK
jgi:hypothetical protein